MAGGIVFDRWHERLRGLAVPLMVGSTAAFFATLLLPRWTIRYELNGLLVPLFVLFLWGLGSNPDLLLARLFRCCRSSRWARRATASSCSCRCGTSSSLVERSSLSGDAVFWLYYAALVLVSVLALKLIDAPLRRTIKRVYAKVLR